MVPKRRATRALEESWSRASASSGQPSFPSATRCWRSTLYARGVDIVSIGAHSSRAARRASDHLPWSRACACLASRADAFGLPPKSPRLPGGHGAEVESASWPAISRSTTSADAPARGDSRGVPVGERSTSPARTSTSRCAPATAHRIHDGLSHHELLGEAGLAHEHNFDGTTRFEIAHEPRPSGVRGCARSSSSNAT